MKIVTVLTLLFLVFNSFTCLHSDPNPVLQSNKEIKALLEKLTDSTAIKSHFGPNYEMKPCARYITSISGCHGSSWIEMHYESLGLTVYNETMSDSKPVNSSSVLLEAKSGWMVKNYLVDQTTFGDLRSEKGVWAEFPEEDTDQSRFAKVTEYVIYYSVPIKNALIDSLKLNADSPKKLEQYFRTQKINQIKLSDNTHLLERLR